MNKSELKKLKNMIGAIKSLNPAVSQKADQKYFDNLQDKIMSKIEGECPIVRSTMVDLIEGNLNELESKKILSHIESCQECAQEYKLVQAVLSNAETVETRGETIDDYFMDLEEAINNTTGNKLSVCELAQEEMTKELTNEAIPADIKKHIDSCAECKKEMLRTQNILSSLKELSVHLPNETYFEEQLINIDAKVETLPSHRLARVEKREKFFTYIAGIIDAVKITIMQPQVAIASAALFALVIIGARFHYSPESIEERQINLSELLSRSTIVNPGLNNIEGSNRIRVLSDSISKPEEDQKLHLQSTGTAKATNKNNSKRIN
jgi:hypothetical protein